jgi:hypothetical protein
VFKELPLAACLGGKVLIVHGGLFDKVLGTLELVSHDIFVLAPTVLILTGFDIRDTSDKTQYKLPFVRNVRHIVLKKDGVTLDDIRRVERRCEPPAEGIM